MNIVSRQAAIGAFVAASLMLGANAGPRIQPSVAAYGASAIGPQMTRFYRGAVATLAEDLQTTRAKVLDDVLDAVGEIAARLKQL